ncbi:hypothetical protein GpartN1_g3612.t1 [Galdieria partita]|uniref:transketolase n=1 Tax=Galdieria partita TaxID=83374 RepID=A0A9C7PXS3_9RHOD|nr:hypothetical protein GpartN1_g3612.t1 [Galdieria partita]
MERHGVESSSSLCRREESVIKCNLPKAAFLTYSVPYMVSGVSGKSRDRRHSLFGSSSVGKPTNLSRRSFLGQEIDSAQDFVGCKVNYEGSRRTRKTPMVTKIEMVETAAKPVTQTGNRLADLCIDSIRFLAIDAVENAKSGHPGMPMGMAPAAYVLFENFLKFNPKNPFWVNRDRFVLSNGHGSMLLYALLYLCGYDSVTLEDIKKFRHIHSRTPGHPENIETAGVEVTTGPLGQGIANAVGLAAAEAHLAAVYNRPGHDLIDHYTYVFMGDGCVMEGISNEACSLAGHLKLGKLIAIYDDNSISIDGKTDVAFTEDVGKRYEALGWHVVTVENGNFDLQAIFDAIQKAKQVHDKPSLIRLKTTIGYGSPNKANTGEVHGAALGAEEVKLTRESLSWPFKEFEVPEEALRHYRRHIETGQRIEREWQAKWEAYKKAFPELAAQFERTVLNKKLPDNWESALISAAEKGGDMATRQASQAMLNALAPMMPELVGGSADLAPSCLTMMKNVPSFQHNCREGRYFHYGVREHAMGAISNGLYHHNTGLRPFAATFFIFTDYMRASIRLSALSRAAVIYIMTHDSVALGEDGPTHQPIEHLASFRAMPNVYMLRPADVTETAAAYIAALKSTSTPSILALSRQKLPKLKNSSVEGCLKGAYILSDNTGSGGTPDFILTASGSEVHVVENAAEKLRQEGKSIRVVSFPCWELFEQQSREYQESVFPPNVGKELRLVCEAGSSFGWERYVGHMVTIDQFGVSGKGDDILKHFGITVENVLKQVKAVL